MSQETSTPQETPQETPQMILTDILYRNSDKIPENDYLRMQNALMQVNNNQRGHICQICRNRIFEEEVDDEEEEEEEEESDDGEEREVILLDMSNVPQRNRINHAMSFILKRAYQNDRYGVLCSCGCDIVCINECELTYSEIKNDIVPTLQSEGFDVNLIYTEDNQFDEEHFDALTIWWRTPNEEPWDSSSTVSATIDGNTAIAHFRHKIERFPKTTDEYHQFEN